MGNKPQFKIMYHAASSEEVIRLEQAVDNLFDHYDISCKGKIDVTKTGKMSVYLQGDIYFVKPKDEKNSGELVWADAEDIGIRLQNITYKIPLTERPDPLQRDE